ncbi:MAG: S41 family peptidase [Muribaculaceae bacterium]|nr:S41 family peptidase [Muribaculaceae bacterium]
MHRIKIFIFSSLATFLMVSCHTLEEWDNTVAGNFDALWTVVDEHYCFFEQKGIDWDSIGAVYRPKAMECRTAGQLFDVCAEMLNTLEDGHVNLSSTFDVSYYRKWWSDYPQDYDQRLVEEHYLHFDWKTAGGLRYAILTPDSIGYVRYSSFSSPVGQSNLDAVLSYLDRCPALIFDVRNNGGGNISYVEDIVARFIDRRILAGYINHKTGPGHNDFSEPYAYYYSPADGRIRWNKPVAVLTNRSTFSAANNFVSVMKHLPGVTIIGARTGGGSGMPLTMDLPVGWTVRMSACSVLDSDGVSTENGVDPSPGHEVGLNPELVSQGRDSMIDHAVKFLLETKQ